MHLYAPTLPALLHTRIKKCIKNAAYGCTGATADKQRVYSYFYRIETHTCDAKRCAPDALTGTHRLLMTIAHAKDTIRVISQIFRQFEEITGFEAQYHTAPGLKVLPKPPSYAGHGRHTNKITTE